MSQFDPIPDLKRQVGEELARLLADGDTRDLGELLETDAPRISELRRGKLTRFSLETLIRYAHRLRRKTVLSFEELHWIFPKRAPTPDRGASRNRGT